MTEHRLIKNFEAVATDKNREDTLRIIESGLESINTEMAVSKAISLKDNILSIFDQNFDLANYKKIKIVGFGKASARAALALEKILGDKIDEGVVIGLHKSDCEYVEIFAGTHPRPSEENITASKRIYEIAKDSNEDDLVIAVVSGGGSALLCYPDSECTQGQVLYDTFLKSGETIIEINTVRKHLSLLKGGGLAKIAYPATVIGLIFSDIAGDNFENVASGPTYKDTSTISDAQKIIDEHNLGKFELLETPKEDKYFEKVHNFVLVSNEVAVNAMADKSRELGFAAKVVSTELYDEVGTAIEKIFSAKEDNTVVLAAGEPKLEVTKSGGKGGRNLYMGLKAIDLKNSEINNHSVFVSFASDGMDNSDVCGAVVDRVTIDKFEKLNIDVKGNLESFDAYTAFVKSGDVILTGSTHANVSDLMILLTRS
jgi:glycerate-2-kinase